MLYLFNSSSRGIYLDNVFATLYLPHGYENVFQYSFIKNPAVDENAKIASVGEDVLIIFLDKFSKESKRYIPLRKGVLSRTEIKDGRIYYFVRLLDYVHATDLKNFSAYIGNVFKLKVYHEIQKDHWAGFLAIRDEKSDIEKRSSLCVSEDSWINTVGVLSDRELFKKEYSLFTRFEITDCKGNKIETRNLEKTWGYKLISQNIYYLNISTYINGLFSEYPMTTLHLIISDTDELCGHQMTKQEVGSSQTFISIPIKISDVDALKKTLFKISCEETSINGKSIRSSNRDCTVFISEGHKAYTKKAIIVICVILFAISTWINTLPVSNILADISKEMDAGSVGWYKTFLYDLCLLLDSAKYYYSAISSAVITLATVVLIHYYGKPNLS